MSDDEEDPIVDEIPVYLTHDLKDNLFVYQFPIHPAASSGNLDVVKSRIKPENQEVVLEIGLDSSSCNYDKSHGEQIASNVDHDKPSSQRTYPTKVMDRIRLESTKSLIDRDSYAIGTMCNGELIISPIRGIVSLSPTFAHISNVEEKEPEVEEDEAKVVRVQFQRAESDRAKKMREASYTHYIEKTGVEPWYNTQYHNVDSAIAKLERTRLTSGFSRGGKPLDLSHENYLNALLPFESDMGSAVAPSLPDHVTSMAELKELPLKDQVFKILQQVKTVDAMQISWLLNCSKSKILDCLQTCAILVQGNWVLRSDLLYKTSTNGIPTTVMANARDYILHEFHCGKSIERKELANKIGIPPEEIKQIMSNLAILRKNKLWQFRLPADGAFVAEYPDIVEQQNMLWEARMRDINEQFALASIASSPTKSRRRKESEASTASTDVEGGDLAIGDVKGGRRRRNSERGSTERPKADGIAEPANPQNRKKACGDSAKTKVKSTAEPKEKSAPEKSAKPDESGKPRKRQKKIKENDMPVPVSLIKKEPIIKQEPSS